MDRQAAYVGHFGVGGRDVTEEWPKTTWYPSGPDQIMVCRIGFLAHHASSAKLAVTA